MLHNICESMGLLIAYSLLDEFINISDFIPFSFYQNYYSKFGKKRDFLLESMLSAFILKNILSIPSIELLITFLSISPRIRNFCGFLRVPHKSQFSRFKSEYLDDLNDLFHNLVDKTEAISKNINPFLSSILITDTTGFETYVTENNPKFYQSELRKSKSHAKYFKVKDSFDAKSLIPALETHFQLHPDFSYKYFLGDAGFDGDDNYAYLHKKILCLLSA